MTKDDWKTRKEVPSRELIQNATQKYNNTVASKEWTKTYPKDAKIISLTIVLSKLNIKKLLSLKHFKDDD